MPLTSLAVSGDIPMPLHSFIREAPPDLSRTERAVWREAEWGLPVEWFRLWAEDFLIARGRSLSRSARW